MRTRRLEELKRHLRPGRVYRREDLLPWSRSVDRHLKELIFRGKGLELIPFEKVEVIFNLPPYLAHNNPAVHDGFGDVAFLIKYRLLSANEEHGNYILTAFLGWRFVQL